GRACGRRSARRRDARSLGGSARTGVTKLRHLWIAAAMPGDRQLDRVQVRGVRRRTSPPLGPSLTPPARTPPCGAAGRRAPPSPPGRNVGTGTVAGSSRQRAAVIGRRAPAWLTPRLLQGGRDV